MAWECVRCQKKIFVPRERAIKFAIEWKYAKRNKVLSVDIRNLKKIKPKATITHVQCGEPEVEGFERRIRDGLKIPDDFDHPLLV